MCECEERANANSSSDRFCVKDVAEIHWLAKILERLSWKICVCMLRIVKYETFRNFVSLDLQKREHFERINMRKYVKYGKRGTRWLSHVQFVMRK